MPSGKNGERGYTAVDITNHALSFPLVPPQQANALFSDGANSTQNTVISLTGNAQVQGEEEMYHNISLTDTLVPNRTPPIFVAVLNTFWTFYVDANTGEGRAEYEINRGFNEYFASRFPNIYNSYLNQQ
jgi:hypothetical protein